MKKNTIVTTTLLGVLLGLAACGQKMQSSTSDSASTDSEFAQGIIDGDTVSTDDLIAQSVVMVYDKTHHGLCSGTLIMQNLVVTAGHCTSANPADLIVIFGLDLNDKKAPVRRVLGGLLTDTFTHLDFTKNDGVPEKNWGDIAVLKFEGHELPAGYKPASVLFNKDVLQTGMTVTLAGYGLDKFEKKGLSSVGVGSGILRKADVTLADSQFSETEILFSTTDGKGACHGDSGGPAYLVLKNKVVLVGVTSRADSNEGALNCNQGTIYTSVPAQQEFLKSATKFLESDAFVPGTPIPQPLGH